MTTQMKKEAIKARELNEALNVQAYFTHTFCKLLNVHTVTFGQVHDNVRQSKVAAFSDTSQCVDFIDSIRAKGYIHIQPERTF